MKNKKLLVILSIVLVVVIAAFAAIYIATKPETDKGDKEISVTVVTKDETEKVFNIDTDAEYLSEALVEEGILTKEEFESKTGMYTVVAGITADYNVDKSFWWVKVNGEDATVGMDSLAISNGDEFEIIYTVG